MKLSQIKTKEVRDRVRKSRYKKFIFAFIVLFLILIVSVCFHSYYAHQKAKKNATAKAQQKMENEYKKAKKEAEKEKTSLKPWYTYHGIAHALGGLNGKQYLNSIDGFYSNYQKGYRIFKMDLQLTSDNVLVGRHTWGDNLSDPLSKHGDPASYREFKNTKLYGRYKPTSFLDMLNAMERYKDFYLMTDSKSTDTPTVQKEFSTLVQTAKKTGKTEYLDRLIVQIYNENMYYTIKKIYPFKHFVYTTYKQRDVAFYKMVKFCKKNGIEGVTSPQNDINDYRMDILAKERIYGFTHTVNNSYFTKEYMKLGVYGIYSDFMTPSEINKNYLEVYCPKFASRYMKTVIPALGK